MTSEEIVKEFESGNPVCCEFECSVEAKEIGGCACRNLRFERLNAGTQVSLSEGYIPIKPRYCQEIDMSKRSKVKLVDKCWLHERMQAKSPKDGNDINIG